MRPLLTALRPGHWVKNAWLAAPLIFAGRWQDGPSLLATCQAMAAFCLLSSAGYLVNDVADAALDRTHAVKRLRPVAARTLAPRLALAAAGVLLAAGLGLAESGARRAGPAPAGSLTTWCAAYVVLAGLYTFVLKAVPVLDVLAVAAGFVLRLLAGSAALALTPSPWLLACGFLLALVLALGKRALEQQADGGGSASRPALARYPRGALRHGLAAASVACLASYVAYTVSPLTTARIGSPVLLVSVPPVAVALARFFALLSRPTQADLVHLLLADRALLLCALAWLAICLPIVGPR